MYNILSAVLWAVGCVLSCLVMISFSATLTLLTLPICCLLQLEQEISCQVLFSLASGTRFTSSHLINC